MGFNQKIMIIATLWLCLTILGNSTYYVLSDPSTTTVQFPLYSEAFLQKNYSFKQPNPLSNGANWIWTNVTTRVAIFETLFMNSFLYSPSTSSNLQIKANNTYYAYLNGVNIRAGKDSTQTIDLALSCGLNNLTIKVENTDVKVNESGLAFLITMNDNPNICINSPGFYNYTSCSCECTGDFTCLPGQIKVSYPICGCKCQNQGFLSCNLNNQYYQKKTCSCQCMKKYCRPTFELDQTTCSCRCKASTCATGTTWNYNQCRCL